MQLPHGSLPPGSPGFGANKILEFFLLRVALVILQVHHQPQRLGKPDASLINTWEKRGGGREVGLCGIKGVAKKGREEERKRGREEERKRGREREDERKRGREREERIPHNQQFILLVFLPERSVLDPRHLVRAGCVDGRPLESLYASRM